MKLASCLPVIRVLTLPKPSLEASSQPESLSARAIFNMASDTEGAGPFCMLLPPSRSVAKLTVNKFDHIQSLLLSLITFLPGLIML